MKRSVPTRSGLPQDTGILTPLYPLAPVPFPPLHQRRDGPGGSHDGGVTIPVSERFNPDRDSFVLLKKR